MGVKLNQDKRNPEALNCQAGFPGGDAVWSLRKGKVRRQRKAAVESNCLQVAAVHRIAMAGGWLLVGLLLGEVAENP